MASCGGICQSSYLLLYWSTNWMYSWLQNKFASSSMFFFLSSFNIIGYLEAQVDLNTIIIKNTKRKLRLNFKQVGGQHA